MNAVFREPTRAPVSLPQYLPPQQAAGGLALPSLSAPLQPCLPFGVNKPICGLLAVQPENPSGHGCPKIWQAPRLNPCSECAEMSLFPPLIVPFLFRRSHWTSRDRRTLPIGKLYDDAKQMSATLRLTEDVINSFCRTPSPAGRKLRQNRLPRFLSVRAMFC